MGPPSADRHPLAAPIVVGPDEHWSTPPDVEMVADYDQAARSGDPPSPDRGSGDAPGRCPGM